MTPGNAPHTVSSRETRSIELALIVSREVSGERQDGARHALDIVEVGEHARALLWFVDELGSQSQARHWRPQVMGDGGDHLVAVAEKPFQACLHQVECVRGAAYLTRPLFR